MKAALGETNLTIIAVIAIGLVAAIAIPLITGILGNVSDEANCTSCGGIIEGGNCVDPVSHGTNSNLTSCLENLNE